MKTLDQRLARLRENVSANEFILADAKDADMAFGTSSPGRCPATGRLRSMQEYRQLIRDVVEQGLIDIALMSASTSSILAGSERRFEASPVTPAVRVNDSTDIWLAGGTGGYGGQPSLPFRSATLAEAMYGHNGSKASGEEPAVRLGLYSVTLNNDAQLDRQTLADYHAFRIEAEQAGFGHFLEVFPPNACRSLGPAEIAPFVADSVARTLAGVPSTSRPLFLKLPYLGPEWTERLAAYDTSVVIGIMGGSAGTTHDAFSLLAEARKYGARAALFGRKINGAEDQLAFVRHLRLIADGHIEAKEAVRSYHAELEKNGLRPLRTVDQDLELTAGGGSPAYSAGNEAAEGGRPAEAVS